MADEEPKSRYGCTRYFVKTTRKFVFRQDKDGLWLYWTYNEDRNKCWWTYNNESQASLTAEYQKLENGQESHIRLAGPDETSTVRPALPVPEPTNTGSSTVPKELVIRRTTTSDKGTSSPTPKSPSVTSARQLLSPRQTATPRSEVAGSPTTTPRPTIKPDRKLLTTFESRYFGQTVYRDPKGPDLDWFFYEFDRKEFVKNKIPGTEKVIQREYEQLILATTKEEITEQVERGEIVSEGATTSRIESRLEQQGISETIPRSSIFDETENLLPLVQYPSITDIKGKSKAATESSPESSDKEPAEEEFDSGSNFEGNTDEEIRDRSPEPEESGNGTEELTNKFAKLDVGNEHKSTELPYSFTNYFPRTSTNPNPTNKTSPTAKLATQTSTSTTTQSRKQFNPIYPRILQPDPSRKKGDSDPTLPSGPPGGGGGDEGEGSGGGGGPPNPNPPGGGPPNPNPPDPANNPMAQQGQGWQIGQLKQPKPPIFNGGIVAYRSWIISVEHYLDTLQITSDVQRINYTLGLMEGSAAYWKQDYVAQQLAHTQTWNEFRDDLDQAFAPVQETYEAERRLRSLKQHGSYIGTYISAFTLAASHAGLSDNPSLHTMFANGLDPDIRYEAIRQAPRTIEEWKDAARNAARIIDTQRQFGHNTRIIL
ncbi:hypothetical protein NP233_g11575 [Leucocoprinus birnbaumii]|uniref:Ty3 transposon capsid-like protein domain-containing protein n=1 Tax=Leucocoprinus birnbaumii TaxID=56174 RepID=A0AAD5YL65_9AGAR|nr:hypothetical protein NP233_g11575 [Leucocoprinus birnbaumii]